MTQPENYISQPCLTDSIYIIFRVIFFNFHEYLPMGVIDVFCWQFGQKFLAEEMRLIMSEPHVYQFALYYQLELASFLSNSFYRVRDSAPDGSSPRGYS
jgi:hypothetical protein